MSKTPKSLDRAREAMRTAYDSIRTEEASLGWMRRFILFHGERHPIERGAAEVAAFLSHLANHEDVAASTQDQARNATLSLYWAVLDRPLVPIAGIAPARRPKRLPSRWSWTAPRSGPCSGRWRGQAD